jgi:hypothetical protein
MTKTVSKIPAKQLNLANDFKIDADGNKIVEPVCWGAGGSIGGLTHIKR